MTARAISFTRIMFWWLLVSYSGHNNYWSSRWSAFVTLIKRNTWVLASLNCPSREHWRIREGNWIRPCQRIRYKIVFSLIFQLRAGPWSNCMNLIKILTKLNLEAKSSCSKFGVKLIRVSCSLSVKFDSLKKECTMDRNQSIYPKF